MRQAGGLLLLLLVTGGARPHIRGARLGTQCGATEWDEAGCPTHAKRRKEITMEKLAIPLPARRSELVSWSSGKKGAYLVRNRRTGETFQVGEQEHFLLEHLDGPQNGEQLSEAFATRFVQPLLADELAEFLELAAQRGFFQAEGTAVPTPPLDPGPSLAQQRLGVHSLLKRIAATLLSVAAAVLRWLALWLQRARLRIRLLRLIRLEFVPRPDDIFIVTYPRSGTTWMQMILYQLTTDGSMDIPHIAEYCPWFERSLRSGRAFETRPSPRLFKSHLPYQKIPKGPGKYIYVAREGKDVAVSYYHLYRMYQGYAGTFAEFFEQFMSGKVQSGSWFRHVRGWWEHGRDPNVLFLTYEELTRDLESCIRKVSDFCGLYVPSERLPGIVARCSFNFMKKHEAQFDPTMETLWEEGVQLNSFLRSGRVGEGKTHLNSEQEARFSRAFRQQLEPAGYSWPIPGGSTTEARVG